MAGSTLPRRALGRLLRQLRLHAKKGQLAAGLHVETSPQSIGRMEDGQKIKISTAQLRDLLDFYGIPNPSTERDEVLGLWEEVKAQDQAAKLAGTTKGWWRSYRDQFQPHFDHYLSLETATNHMTTHQLVLMPGLLQTPEYRRALTKGDEPDLSAVDLERRLELAARRQARLDEPGFGIDALISEAVLRHLPGKPEVMAEQLNWLATASERDNISVRVVPFGLAVPRGLVIQSFTLLEFPSLAGRLVEPPVVYVEGAEGALYLERDDVIDRYRKAITAIRAVALNQDDTRELVLNIAKEYAA
ncbi:helix-turn-helix domain-containing protein [Nocardia uniformis]|uniref:Helix-turn-helix domain-containing protein n=1 Tax=Nocardia uniformis TaxID=53432 RepID=A0A849C8Z1_9NOCA|nr:DUF5753 domain-containing protein [Nocardia uniformis]NNH75124.1 helix-turn-helix domain-containing protein [Nocardia uniformis]